MRTSSRACIPPAHQPDAVLTQANPVSGTKYTVLDTTKNVRIISIHALVTWTVQPTPLEIHITIDGQTIICSIANPDSDIAHVAENFTNSPNWGLVAAYQQDTAFILEGRSVKIEAEITGGAVSNLAARVKYAKW